MDPSSDTGGRTLISCTTNDGNDPSVKSSNEESSSVNKLDQVSKDSALVEDNPFAYLEKNGFSSEKFKIEIRGLPKYYGLGELKKLLTQKLGLHCNKIKSPGNRSFWLYACFRSEEDRNHALKVLDKYCWKGSTLEVKIADPAPDPLVKRRNEENTAGNQNKKIKLETPEQLEEAIKNSTIPLWNVPYDLQLKQKSDAAEALLRRLGTQLSKANSDLTNWIERQRKINRGLPCKFLEIRSLPEYINRYRNKCEFTIGINELNGEKTVGFRFGSYASGTVSVAPIDNLQHIPEPMIKAAKVFEKFVKLSNLDTFTPETLKGHWVQLTVRVGSLTGQIMLIAGFHPQNMTSEELDRVKQDLRDFFSKGEGSELQLTSLYFEIIKRREHNNDVHPIELLLGEKYIEEILCGMKFKISPHSFFQVNTRCSELLVKSVKDLSGITPETSVLDICCGTGTIGLCLAKDCKEVLGIELVPEAVEDAKKNASLNNTSNCEFFCGKADDIIGSVASRAKGEQTVAIVDPPRAGLSNRAITLLRKTKNLDRFVFLSCNPKLAFNNFIEFGKPQSKKMFGSPFVPIKAMPVDMFPHSPHFEMVIYFERLEVAKKNISLSESDLALDSSQV